MVSNEIRGYRAQNFLSVGSSEWGMVVPASIARVLPRPTFSANCKAGMATLSAIHFASTILARSKYYIPYQSQTGACCLGFVQPTTEGRTRDVFSCLRWSHKFLYASWIIYLRHFGVLQVGYDHLHNWWGSGGNTRFIHLGMQMPTICMNLFGFYPRYKQDLRVVGRLFVATAGVD